MLCLAAGGGKQSALYAAAGAEVTVVDLSPEMLALDRQVAAERSWRSARSKRRWTIWACSPRPVSTSSCSR